jgi:chemotaxis protein histidine kinase CheA
MSSNDLFETLETEFKELIERIESDILELENSKNPEIIHSIFRAIHTIKGNSAMVGMDRLRGISHCLETLFSRIRSKEMELKTEMIEIVLKSIDRMKAMILDLKNESNYEVKDLIIVLEKILNNDSIAEKEDTKKEEDFSLFIETAKNENKFLTLVDINFEANPHLTLGEWIQKINSIELSIQSKRINIEEIASISLNRDKYPLPYSILIMTDEDPEIFLEKTVFPILK